MTQAASGNTKRAIEALEQAAAHGFRGWDRAEAEPLLAKVRRDPRYAKARSRALGGPGGPPY